MLSFIYCLDENYNHQLSVSLLSLLENIDEKLSIYIIHKSESNSNFLPEKIKCHRNIDTISVFKFFKNIENFPKLNKAHVSEATYYRLFINEYLPKEIDFLLFLDKQEHIVLVVSCPEALVVLLLIRPQTEPQNE